MKIARATDGDMERMVEFFSELEEMLRDLRHGGSVENETLGALVKKHWGKVGPGVGASWCRVIWGMDTLLRTCTDPDADSLEWRPDIQELLNRSKEEAKPEAKDVRHLTPPFRSPAGGTT